MSAVRTASKPMVLRDTAPDTSSGTSIEHMTPVPGAGIDGLPSDRQFVAVRAAYRATGGTARGLDLARLLAYRRLGDFASLARLIVSGEIFSFEWHDTFWVPMFQFELRDLSIKQGPRQVRAELASELDGWTLAVWFVQPSSWLNGRRPVDLLESNLPAVLDAARGDRFIATG